MAASAAEASRGYFGHNFPLATLEKFAKLHHDSLTDPERLLIGACLPLSYLSTLACGCARMLTHL